MGKGSIHANKKTITTNVDRRIYDDFSHKCDAMGIYKNEAIEALMKFYVDGDISLVVGDKITVK